MKSKATPEFWEAYLKLPKHIRKLADKNFALWRRDPDHPSLRFKKIKNSRTLYSARVGINFRAIGSLKADSVVWLWIGSHDEYEHLLNEIE